MSEIEKELTPFEQLMVLKDATERLGCLHDAQAFQLKRYPFAITNVTGAEVHVDMFNRKVEFVVTTKGKGKDDAERQRYIDSCVKTLLGDTWFVVIKTAKKTLYRGRRKKAYTPKVDKDGYFSDEDGTSRRADGR
jgi:hypothetical protein